MNDAPKPTYILILVISTVQFLLMWKCVMPYISVTVLGPARQPSWIQQRQLARLPEFQLSPEQLVRLRHEAWQSLRELAHTTLSPPDTWMFLVATHVTEHEDIQPTAAITLSSLYNNSILTNKLHLLQPLLPEFSYNQRSRHHNGQLTC